MASDYGSTPGTDKSFFGALFDLSFTSFVTTKIIKVLFILAMVLVGIWSLAVLFSGIAQGGGAAVLALVLSPVMFLFGIVYARVLLEFIAVVFRIADHTATIAANTGGGAAGPTASGWAPTTPPAPPAPTQPPEDGPAAPGW